MKAKLLFGMLLVGLAVFCIAGCSINCCHAGFGIETVGVWHHGRRHHDHWGYECRHHGHRHHDCSFHGGFIVVDP